ncbi:MAG: hypothetical protein JXQ83_13330 [Candidatus Glassbacteria bacterium]|nr:hypothetical protein [Candidatus Glassbacteria bacterium]
MATATTVNQDQKIRVIDCRNGFILPYLEEVRRLFSMIGVRYSGFGNYETNGFVFARTGGITCEFIDDYRGKTGYSGSTDNNCFTCFRSLKEFRREFPQVDIKILDMA